MRTPIRTLVRKGQHSPMNTNEALSIYIRTLVRKGQLSRMTGYMCETLCQVYLVTPVTPVTPYVFMWGNAFNNI